MQSVTKDPMSLLMDKPGAGYHMLVAVLLMAAGAGLVAWSLQLSRGLGVTGLSTAVPWGVYIVNFVFFVGISYAGTLLSAVLRLIGAEWRRPITRVAEVVTVAALIIAGLMIFADLGRPERAALNMLQFGRVESPLIWDMVVLSTYLAGALLFLLLPLIPDMAHCRDKYRPQGGIRYRFYRALSFGWVDTEAQKHRLEKAMSIVAITIIPVAILAHSVVAWIFGLTLRPMWHSTIFAPYFVLGAIFSGTAVIIVVMALYRRFAHLGEYFTASHFQKLGYILLVLNLAYMYFTFSEYLTVGYHVKEGYRATLTSIMSGAHAPYFWFAIIIGLMVPALLVILPWTRNIRGITIASVLVVVGMWLKRWIMVVPPLENTFTPAGMGTYGPNWVEWTITGAGFAVMGLIFLVFQRVFPMVAIWEVEEGRRMHKSIPKSIPLIIAGFLLLGAASVQAQTPVQAQADVLPGQSLQATTLTIEVADQGTQRQGLPVKVALTNAAGEPLVGERVSVYTTSRFFDRTGTIKVGEVRIRFDGTGSLVYTPTAPGAGQLVAEYLGRDGVAAAATARTPVSIAPAAVATSEQAQQAPVYIFGRASTWVITLLTGVWLAFGVAVYHMIRLPSEAAPMRQAVPADGRDPYYPTADRA